MSYWRYVPNFVILSVGQFTDNSDVCAYALNAHWYGIFKRCISCFPNLFVSLPSVNRPLQSTEYQVLRGQVYIVPWRVDYHNIAQFECLRHLTIINDEYGVAISATVWSNLCSALHQLPHLQTITLDGISGGKIGNPDLIFNLPAKITSINTNEIKDLSFLETQFAQLIHCDAPWDSGWEQYCSKMPNLCSLVLYNLPTSFHCFTMMHELKTLKWVIMPAMVLEEWNQFASAVSPTLRTLHIDFAYFKIILNASDAFPLPFLTTFYLDTLPDEDLRFSPKKIMPQLKHYHVVLPAVKSSLDQERLTEYMLKYSAQNQLDTFSTYFLDASYISMRMTYCKGDRNVFTGLYKQHNFGLNDGSPFLL